MALTTKTIWEIPTDADEMKNADVFDPEDLGAWFYIGAGDIEGNVIRIIEITEPRQ